MAEMMTVKQASELWGIFDSRITKLCREGEIPCAVKSRKSWLIPKDTPRPVDKRYKNQPQTKNNQKDRLPLPVGVLCLSVFPNTVWRRHNTIISTKP